MTSHQGTSILLPIVGGIITSPSKAFLHRLLCYIALRCQYFSQMTPAYDEVYWKLKEQYSDVQKGERWNRADKPFSHIIHHRHSTKQMDENQVRAVFYYLWRITFKSKLTYIFCPKIRKWNKELENFQYYLVGKYAQWNQLFWED